MPTCDAAIGGLEVGDEVLATRLNAEQFSVWNGDDAAGPPVASKFDVVENVSETSDVVVDRQTAPDPHATVASGCYQNDLIASGARRVERLPLTVLLHLRHEHCNAQQDSRSG